MFVVIVHREPPAVDHAFGPFRTQEEAREAGPGLAGHRSWEAVHVGTAPTAEPDARSKVATLLATVYRLERGYVSDADYVTADLVIDAVLSSLVATPAE